LGAPKLGPRSLVALVLFALRALAPHERADHFRVHDRERDALNGCSVR